MYCIPTDTNFDIFMKHIPNKECERDLYSALNTAKPFLGIVLLDKRSDMLITTNWPVDVGMELLSEDRRLRANNVPFTDDPISDDTFSDLWKYVSQNLDPKMPQRVTLVEILKHAGPEIYHPNRIKSSIVLFIKPKSRDLPIESYVTSSFIASC